MRQLYSDEQIKSIRLSMDLPFGAHFQWVPKWTEQLQRHVENLMELAQ